MELLKQRILDEGQNLGRGILKVDSFLNHQVDPAFMLAVGGALAADFGALGVTKVLTAEISGIVPAVTTALALGVKVVYARKTRPITMPKDAYTQSAPSHTKGQMVELMVSPEFLHADDRVLVVDDFLASGATIKALAALAESAGAEVLGIGTVIEKKFEGGREGLENLGYRVRSLAVIERMTDDEIILA
ncbi:xanthine phosphoribosyltransferase [candidate division KSB3 bacterium]|uniref:Xanthine phosphoribosyltransferase n=1 Tax=candidate division KSB3 bacterium TaxID=2044937 RepID=A0A2G6E2B0_9BACT|nr:MAG: xanthine phosphoribosyltransferase [candidate division KSB3 bacterium]PIE28799.1 MAG: xanthine phosphoribosyltransferase [candidate division KSB3 bacterium]